MSTRTKDTNLYREIFERLGDAGCILDLKGERFVDVNERACDLLGYSHSALMELGPLGVHSHEVALWRKCVAAASRDRSITIPELSCRTVSGDLLPVEITATAIEIDGKQRVILVVRDPMSRLLIQQRVQESEERYRSLVNESPDLILVQIDGTIMFVNSTGPKLLGLETPPDMVGRPFTDFVVPEFRDLVRERANRVFRRGESVPAAEIELLRADGSKVHVEGIATPIKFSGESAVQVVLRDISERKRMEHERSVIAEIGTVVGSTLAIGEVYEHFASLMKSLIPFDRIVISEFDLASDTICAVYVSGHQVEGWEEGVVHPISVTLLRPVISNREALLFDVQSFADHAEKNPENAAGVAAGFTTGLAVPLVVRDQVIGVLNLSSFDPDAFKYEHLEMLKLVANQIAPAIENARLFKQVAVIAGLEERNRLARDLHDSVAQSLYSLALFSEASIRHARAGDMKRVQANLDQLGESALQALREMRLLLHQLRPRELEDEGLISALQHRLNAVEARSGIQARLILDREYNLPAKIENVLFRIALEALNNIIKHSSASVVEISVNTVDGGVALTVEDNGRGFEVAEPSAQSGVGLSSMNERLRGIGGTLSVTSIVGRGTTIRAFIEIDSPNPEPSTLDCTAE